MTRRPSHARRFAHLVLALLIANSRVQADQAPPSPLETAVKAAELAKGEEAAAAKLVAERTAISAKAEAAVKACQDAVARATEFLAAAPAEAKPAAEKSLQLAQQSVAAAVEAQKPAAQAKTAAEQQFAQKQAAALAAQAKVLAEQAWLDRVRLRNAENERTAATQLLAKATAEAQAAAQKMATALQSAQTAAAARIEAEKALAAAAPDKQAVLKKNVEVATAAANTMAAQAAEAQKLVDQTAAQKSSAEKALAEKNAQVTSQLDQTALSQAVAIGGLKPISSQQWDYAKARHLLFRAGFGGSPEQVQRLYEMGPQRAVDFLVDYHDQPPANIEFDVPNTERWLAYETRLHDQAREQIWNDRLNRHRAQIGALRQWWLRRMVESPRPLEEKLVLFWHDHFSTGFSKLLETLGVQEIFVLHRQNQELRRYADKFDALLHGIVQDPAMIWYLDNHLNRKGNVNENLGREVLELFTLGEEHSSAHKPDGYSEQDVRDGNTRALTGVNVDYWTGQYRFYVSQHDPGEKTLLGRKGAWGPHEAVDVILQHPHTARYVAKKLYKFFVHNEPEPEVVERLAHVLRENSYELRPMLKNLFLSEEFYSPKAIAHHIKSPVELMVGTAKILKLNKVDYGYMDWACGTMGQTLLEPPNVAGWPEGSDWVNANLIMHRYNFVANLVEQGGVDVVASLEGRNFNNAAEVLDHLTQRCLVTGLTPEKRTVLLGFLGDLPPSAQWSGQRDQINGKLRALLVMLMSLPEYQVS